MIKRVHLNPKGRVYTHELMFEYILCINNAKIKKDNGSAEILKK